MTVVKFFAGKGTQALAEKIAIAYDNPLGASTSQKFSDGELHVSYDESIRGCEVFLIQSTNPPADNILELLLMIDAARRASAKYVTVVVPYFGYARQDRKDKPRVAIGSKLIANMLTAAGITRLMTMDLHADQIQGFFDLPVDHLFASTIFLPYLRSLNLTNLLIAAPDTGGTKRANAYAKFLDCGLAICYKQRKVANEVSKMTVIGDVKGKDVVIVDDIIDTAGTLTKAADMMLDEGANTVRAIITHPVLSGPAYDRLTQSNITELIVSDTIPLKQSHPKIRVITVADLFKDVIDNVINKESISSHFII